MKDLHILISSYRMVRDLDRATTKICSSYGLTYPQFQVLEALLHKGDLTVGEIRDSILSSNGTVPVIINNLEKTGMVTRAKNPLDNRRTIVSLTEKARKIITQVWDENEKMFTEKFSVWTEDEKREMIRLFNLYRKEHLKKGDQSWKRTDWKHSVTA